MHELTIASNILKIAKQVARENYLSRVTRIKVKVGIWSCINEESLRFALDCLANEPWIEGVNLEIERISSKENLQEMYVESIEGERNGDKSTQTDS